MNFHVSSAMRKSTFEEVWQLEPEILHNTCKNRFRGLNDVNQYVMSWYNICKGEFVPRKANFGKFYTIGTDSDALITDILYHRHKMICINDNPMEVDVETEKAKLLSALEKMLPNKSSFEL